MSTSQSTRVLVLGFDAATFWLIEPWIKAGYLPTFSRLVKEGVSGKLASTIPYVSGPAWVSFATGKQPGKHGIFDFATRNAGSYDIQLINAQNVASETLWSLLSQQQKRVAVVNMPITYPPPPVNGFMVTSMLTPSIKSQFTYPPDLRGEILNMFPDYVIEVAETSPDRVRTKEAVAHRTHQATDQRLALTYRLMKKMPDWDLFITVWTGTDRIQHYLWDDIDPAHPQHTARLAQRFGEEILKHYQALDRILSDVLQTTLDERTILFVISDHGFGGVHRFFYPNRWLEKKGYLRLKHGRSRAARMQALKKILAQLGIAHQAKRLFSAFTPGLGTTQLRHTTFIEDVDWQQTRAFWAADNGISINLRGREPLGIVEPGKEYEKLCQELKTELMEVREPESGEKVIAQVYHRSELYGGPWVANSPDLRIRWQEYPTQRKTYAAAGDLWGPDVFGDSGQTGDHTFYGIMLAYGKPLKRGYNVEKATIIDLAPTILYAMGLPIPQDMDGRILNEIFTDKWIQAHPPETSSMSTSVHPRSQDQQSDDDIIVRKRLQDLGYIG